MDMPRPGAEHARLEAFAGTWRGAETMFPSMWDPRGGTATAFTTARMDLDGFFLLLDYRQERDGRVTYRGHGVFGYDVRDGTYTMHWYDSMGGGGYEAPARGTWEGDVLTFQNQTPFGHARYVYALEGPDRYRFRLETSRDGASWKPMVEGLFTKGS